MRKYLLFLFALPLIGCSALLYHNWDDLYGPVDPTRYDQPKFAGGPDYWQDVNPILENRCVVCHSCYDAPCQLKLTAYEGLTRGASRDLVYDGTRLLAATPNRLFQDAALPSQWRQRGFFPMLNERDDTPEGNRDLSVLARLLELKQQHPLPQEALPASFDFNLDRAQQCPTIEQFDSYAQRLPLWGMPYGLPALNDAEHATLMAWIENGAPYRPRPQLTPFHLNRIGEWEAFLNGGSLKSRLMTRYIYEHLFLSHIYFEDSGRPQFFELVRSKTPPGKPIDAIVTTRPYDDPGVERVYYRLRPHRETIVAKTHMPYRLDAARMHRWREWFLGQDYAVTQLPGYAAETASNPFVTFQAIPARSRYRFMLDEAQHTIMGFIKGPVCRGQVALNVINDHFWVFFIDPDLFSVELDTDLLATNLHDLRLPAENASNAGLLSWLAQARSEKRYLKAKVDFYNRAFASNTPLDTTTIWDGDGRNDNAALTVFRHFDSATVIKGLQGERPQTAWVVGYPLLERIHYLLVAGFDVYGNVGHQLSSRIYMDFLRMEGEFSFLALLPAADRATVRSRWYRGSTGPLEEHITQQARGFTIESAIEYRTDDHLDELYGLLKQRVRPVLNREHDLRAHIPDAALAHSLQRLEQVDGSAAAVLPQMLFLRIGDGRQATYVTLLHNNAHANISHLFNEEERRLPAEDTLTAAYGLVGAYPNQLLAVRRDQVETLVDTIGQLRSEQDYRALLDRFGVRRSDPAFWAYSDALHARYAEQAPIEAGVLDYNRLDNR